MAIKNVVFDVGNVLVRWDPQNIVSKTFPKEPDPLALMRTIFAHQTWYDLNLGVITEQEAIDKYHERLHIEKPILQQLINNARDSLLPIPGSFAILETLNQLNYNLFALTDNTKEFMRHLREKYQFWQYFQGVVVSAEIGYLKPSKEIYQYLLDTYQLIPQETVFIDDLERNILGAKKLGMHGVIFVDAVQCQESLVELEIRL